MSVNTPCSHGRRDYDFSIHGARNYEARQRRRRERQTPRPVSPIQTGIASFDAVTDHENLLQVFYRLKRDGGQAPGIDGLTYVDFGKAEIAAAVRVASRAIRERRYLPQPTRRVDIPRPNRTPRTLRLGTIIDRVIATAVNEAVDPLIDPVLLPGCMGFRKGYSVMMLLATMERQMIEQERWVMATDDVANAFPSVQVAQALAGFARHVADQQLLRLIEVILRGNEGEARHDGLYQGCALSPLAMNLTLHYILDQPLSVDPNNPPWLRYADNIVYLCQSVSAGRLALQRARDLLLPAGLHLKGEDGEPADLTIQGTARQLLGFRLSKDQDRLRFGVGDGTWDRLRQSLDEAHEAPHPARTARDAVHGWLGWLGPVYGNAEEGAVVELVRGIAAEKGFRELGSPEELITTARRAQEDWVHIREDAWL